MNGQPARDKILSAEALLSRTRHARRLGETIVFTNGCFDLLHVGHARSLEEASGFGDRLIVAVNLDASVRRSKGPERPIMPARERMEIVASLACVDWVVGFAADTPLRLIERIRPDVLAKGGDWALDQIVGRAFVEGAGGRIERLRVVPGLGTTDVIARIRTRTARGKR